MLNWPGAKRYAARVAASSRRSCRVKMVGDSSVRASTVAACGGPASIGLRITLFPSPACGRRGRGPGRDLIGTGGQRSDLFGEINADRAPGDAAAAAYAAAAAELVVPGRELVRQPLAVAGTNVGSHVDAVQMAVRLAEARV